MNDKKHTHTHKTRSGQNLLYEENKNEKFINVKF